MSQSEAVSSEGRTLSTWHAWPVFEWVSSITFAPWSVIFSLLPAWISVRFWAQLLFQGHFSHKTASVASPEFQGWVWSNTNYVRPLACPFVGAEMNEWIEVLNNAIAHSLHHQRSSLSLDEQELLSPTDDLTLSPTSASSSPTFPPPDLKKDKWGCSVLHTWLSLLSCSSPSLSLSLSLCKQRWIWLGYFWVVLCLYSVVEMNTSCFSQYLFWCVW